MELHHYLAIVRRRWLLLLLCAVAGAAAGWVGTPRETTYRAESTIYVGSSRVDAAPTDLSFDRLAALDRVLLTYSVMIDSRPIAQAAIDSTGVARSADSLVAQTTATPIPNTQLLRIAVEDVDPAYAQLMANALAEAFVDNIQRFEVVTPPSGSTPDDVVQGLPAYVYESAALPAVPRSQPLTRNMAIGAFFGVLAASVAALVLDYLDVSLRGSEDTERRLELPVLGTIPFDPAISYGRRGLALRPDDA